MHTNTMVKGLRYSRRRLSTVFRIRPILAAYCALAGVLSGCSQLGAEAIRSGRLDYNDAIAETSDQQMLLVPVRNRYAEEAHLLAVSSVTANVSVRSNAGVQLGFGDDETFSGNLVPFSATTSYEENPTISYLPVGGEQYLQQITSPIPVAQVARLASTLTNSDQVYRSLLTSVNGISNPDFLYPSVEPDPRFDRVVDLMTTLGRTGHVHWIEDATRPGELLLAFSPGDSADVDELFGLLGLPPSRDPPGVAMVPVSLALDSRSAGGIGVNTRSVLRLVEIFSAAVEVPPEHDGAGVAINYPSLSPVGSKLRIRYSATVPENAAVAVQYREGWYYIDDSDQATKQFFRLLATLWSVSISEQATRMPGAPMLTVPVSR